MEQAKRFQNLDLLRVIAALTIALYHFLLHKTPDYALFPQFKPDQPAFRIMADAVLIFFAVSAIVLPAHLLNNNYQLAAFPKFLGKRLLRIYLPFLAAVCAILLVDFAFHLKNHEPFHLDGKQLISNLTFSCEFTGIPWYNSVFWTLAIELQFYVFIGLVFPLIRKYGFTAVTAFFILGECATYFWEDTRLLYYYTPYFTIGFLLYLWLQKELSLIHTIISIGMVGIAIFGINEPITLWTIIVIPAIVIGIRKLPVWCSFGGKYSYSFYLIHGLIGGHILYFTRHWNNAPAIILLKIVVALIASAIVAWIFYRFIEQPSLKWGRSIRYNKK